MDLQRIPSSTHGHDFNSGQSRVVMVRKTEQRTFQVPQDGEEKPKFEKVTRETVQTFNGQRVQKTTTRRVFTDSDRGGETRQAIVIETHEEVIGGPMPGQSNRPGPSQGNRGPAGAMIVGPMPGQHNRQQPSTSSYNDRGGPAPSQADRNNRGSGSPKDQMDKTPSQTSQGRPSPSGSSQMVDPRGHKASGGTNQGRAGPSYRESQRDRNAPGPSNRDSQRDRNGPGPSRENQKDRNAPGPSRENQKDRNAPGPSTSPKAQQGAQPKQKKKTASPGRKDDSVGEYSRFAEDCLLAHNKYRAKHNVPPLKLNKKLCQFSEEWARRLASTGQMQHRPNSDYGENLFCVWSSDPNHKVTGNEPVDNWYAEIKDFLFGQEPRDLRAGHFTQVVWKDSKQLGVALAKSKNGQTFVVCNYEPPGNFIGNFSSQVPPIGGNQQSYPPPPPPKKEERKSKESSASSKSPKSSSRDEDSRDGSSSGGSTSQPEDTDEAPSRPPQGPKHTRESDMVLMNDSEQLHNELRAKHGCPPLRNDLDLSRHAKEWADTLIRENKFAHRPNNKYGENIFCHWTNDPAAADTVGAKEAVNAWYSEIKDFRFGEEPRTLKSGHFTQVIWKNSKRVGIGRARDGKGRVIIVANYDPRGNYVGQFTNNCPPPQK